MSLGIVKVRYHFKHRHQSANHCPQRVLALHHCLQRPWRRWIGPRVLSFDYCNRALLQQKARYRHWNRNHRRSNWRDYFPVDLAAPHSTNWVCLGNKDHCSHLNGSLRVLEYFHQREDHTREKLQCSAGSPDSCPSYFCPHGSGCLSS